MLKPSECFAGPISSATGMTFVLPRSDYEHLVLIVKCDEKLHAICLDDARGFNKFVAFECESNDRWRGLLIPNVEIELDETSLCDADNSFAPIGTFTRKGDRLVFNGSHIGERSGWENPVTAMNGLPLCADHLTACFKRWQIVLGSGDAKRVLHRVDVSPK